MRTKPDLLPNIKNCPNCDALIPADDKTCSFCKYKYQPVILTKEEAAQPYTEHVKSIDNAFFRIESFMEGKLLDYKGFDFARAFSVLFHRTSEAVNFTIDNCRKVGQYYLLIGQLAYDWDKTDYPNQAANKNPKFVEDMEAISYLSWYHDYEFVKFLSSEDQNDRNQKYSIMDTFSHSTIPDIESHGTAPNSAVEEFFESVNDCRGTQIAYSEESLPAFRDERLPLIPDETLPVATGLEHFGCVYYNQY